VCLCIADLNLLHSSLPNKLMWINLTCENGLHQWINVILWRRTATAKCGMATKAHKILLSALILSLHWNELHFLATITYDSTELHNFATSTKMYTAHPKYVVSTVYIIAQHTEMRLQWFICFASKKSNRSALTCYNCPKFVGNIKLPTVIPPKIKCMKN